ncbi:hypothetical protein AAHE18_11G236600 [Arachis hypogaea]
MGKASQVNKNNNHNLSVINGSTTKVKRTRRSVPRDSPPQRSSIYRGVTRWTGRYEAHLWDKNCWNESQNKKGRQVYLGAYDDEEAAAHAYDLAALKYWGQDTILNFPVSKYQNELKEMEGQSREEYIGSLRRKSSGFSRGVSKYRGVARHHHNGRWEARIGRVFGNKYLYLGTYATQEEAATAYDMAAIEYRGLNAVTNFDLSRYIKWLKPNNNSNENDHNNNNNRISFNLAAAVAVDDVNPNCNNTNFTPNFNNNNKEHEYSLFNHEPLFINNNNIDNNNNINNNNGSKLGQARPGATSALELLLQSSKFKEMMEMTSSVANNNNPSTPAECSDELPQCNFPEDIQTYFEYEDSNKYEGGDHDTLFNEIHSFVPMFHCDDFEN